MATSAEVKETRHAWPDDLEELTFAWAEARFAYKTLMMSSDLTYRNIGDAVSQMDKAMDRLDNAIARAQRRLR